MRLVTHLVVATLGVSAPSSGAAPDQPSLQALVDAAPAGSVLRLRPGRYSGPIVIEKPLTLDGEGLVTIDGAGRGTLVMAHGGHVTVRGLHLTGTGGSHDAMDSAVWVEGDGNRVEENVIDDSLFGVQVRSGADNVVCGNRITSKVDEPGLRGDGVRVWNARSTKVVGNDIVATRDVSLANSSQSLVADNVVRGGRYGLQLVFSPKTWVEGNWLDANLTGIAVLYSDNVVIRRNRVQHSRGVSGAGITFKESSLGVVGENSVLHCAVGARANSPTHPMNVIFFHHNRFAHNVSGMDFYGENGGHLIYRNRFEKNLTSVTVSAPMSARGNDWRHNSWDDYQGFDRDGDGVGDTPFELFAFTDRIWMENPQATFFRNSPALELLDFLERLAPFSSPDLLLSDPQPVMTASEESAGIDAPPTPSCRAVTAVALGASP